MYNIIEYIFMNVNQRKSWKYFFRIYTYIKILIKDLWQRCHSVKIFYFCVILAWGYTKTHHKSQKD